MRGRRRLLDSALGGRGGESCPGGRVAGRRDDDEDSSSDEKAVDHRAGRKPHPPGLQNKGDRGAERAGGGKAGGGKAGAASEGKGLVSSELVEAVTRVQAVVRSKQARAQYLRLKHAAETVQKQVRAGHHAQPVVKRTNGGTRCVDEGCWRLWVVVIPSMKAALCDLLFMKGLGPRTSAPHRA